MEPKFNIDRPKISDEEINKRKDFDRLVKEFKERSLKQAQGDESWRGNKKIRYSTVIAGATVICTVTLFALLTTKKTSSNTHETLTTPIVQKKTTAARKAFVSAPSASLRIPYSSYRVSGAKGGSITHQGSKIKVPAGSFVSKSGEDIVGDVTIEYREFHDPADIVVSGIPMAYDSAGHKYNLESAGMFDIRGSYNGEPVFIKPDKQLDVTLASASSENRFNQYFLDTVARNWQYLKRDHAIPVKNPEHRPQAAPVPARLAALKNNIEVVIPRRVDSVKTVYTRRVAQLPRPKEPLKPVASTKGKPTFKLDGSHHEFPELSAFNNVIFEVGPENTNYTKEFHSITWSDVKMGQGPDKGRNYYLTLSYRSRTERLIVYPVLSGADLEKANGIYAEKLASYEQLAKKRQADEKRLMDELAAKQQIYLADLKKKQEAYDLELAKLRAKQQNDMAASFDLMSATMKATRLFSISQFGIYNSDCPHSALPAGGITPRFVLAGKQEVVPDHLYLVDHNSRSVFNLNKSNGFQMNVNGDNAYSICVFIQNRLFLCNKDAFKTATANKGSTFVLTPLPGTANNLVDFKNALEI